MRSILYICVLSLCLLVLPGVAGAQVVVGFLTAEGGLGDKSYNDMTMDGLKQAREELGIKLVYVIPKQGKLQEGMDELLGKGAQLIVSNGFSMADVMTEAAKANPDRKFLINDFFVEGIPNLATTSFAQHEGSFLVGALSALTTKTGTIGFVGANEFPIIMAFQTGWQEGATYAKADVKQEVGYVTPGKDVSGFSKPREAYKVANAMFGSGADIIFAVAGGSGAGVINAAKKADAFAVGVDSDQDHLAKGNVLTSMMKRLDNATFAEVKKFEAGNFTAGNTDYNLANGGVSLSPMTYTKDKVDPAVLAEVEAIKQKIIAGEITVTNVLAP